ncbi:MAG TPA: hypothetical protein VIG30_04310 [Ktedonobacterales bacterium]
MSPEDSPTITLTVDEYDAARRLAPQPARNGPGTHGAALVVGSARWPARATLACPGALPASVARLIAGAMVYGDLAGGANPAQLPALLFDATGDPWPLAHFFALAGALDEAARGAWFAAVAAIAAHPGFDLRLIGARRVDLTERMPPSTRWLAAGHVAEVLGQRPDILATFLAQPRHFRLYATPAAFADDGGVAGGDYDAGRERIQLGLARLFEGFGGARPGVAPFLHELGHMLDAFAPASGGMRQSHGTLPGLDPADGPLYDAEARRLFVAGKALEAARYEALHTGAERARDDDTNLPLGHPYVFQNDGEFIAGYLELYLRTPNRFAARNPALYDGLSRLLRQDPRVAWPEDFDFYVRENRAVYLRGESLARAGITVPPTT